MDSHTTCNNDLSKGCVIAIDKTPSKIVKLKENVAKFCCSIVQCFLFDSTVLISNDIQFIINPEGMKIYIDPSS